MMDGELKRDVDLDDDDSRIAEEFATEAVAGMHLQDREADEQREQVMMGKLAEIAFKKFCAIHNVEVFVDVGIYPGIDGIDESDIFDQDERPLGLDVKAVKPNAKYLLLKWSEKHEAAYYVAVRVWLDEMRARLIGWTTRKYATKDSLCKGDCIPGTKTVLRMNNYITPLKDLCWHDADLELLLDKIRSGGMVEGHSDDP